MAPIYEKVKFQDGNRTRSVFLRITGESDLFLKGIEIDKYAEEISGVGFDQRLRIIDKNVIQSRRRYVMDNHYGELVPMRRR